MEVVPKNLKETLVLAGDYALDCWLLQIHKGEAVHSNLLPEHALILYHLIKFSEELVAKEDE